MARYILLSISFVSCIYPTGTRLGFVHEYSQRDKRGGLYADILDLFRVGEASV